MNLRFADEHDAAACLAIYAQYIDTSITFETALPSEDEFAGRIRSYGAVYPWLIAEEDGEILAYAYAHRAQERAAYDWNAELSVYVSKNAAGRGLVIDAHMRGLQPSERARAVHDIRKPAPDALVLLRRLIRHVRKDAEGGDIGKVPVGAERADVQRV